MVFQHSSKMLLRNVQKFWVYFFKRPRNKIIQITFFSLHIQGHRNRRGSYQYLGNIVVKSKDLQCAYELCAPPIFGIFLRPWYHNILRFLQVSYMTCTFFFWSQISVQTILKSIGYCPLLQHTWNWKCTCCIK